MTESRKRRRSEVSDFSLQTKFYVNQQLVDQNSDELMKMIHEKTLGMIFAGAKAQRQSSQQKAKGNNDSMVLDTIDDKFSEPEGCTNCWKDVGKDYHYICKNCSLKICYRCKGNCVSCSTPLCSNCIKIFGCSVGGQGDSPICEECKFIMT